MKGNNNQISPSASRPRGQQFAESWEQKYKVLLKSDNDRKEQQRLSDIKISTLNNSLMEAKSTIEKLKKTQLLFMDWAVQQEWELPEHIRERLPMDSVFKMKAAIEKVPMGKSPAEYSLNLLLFLSLPEKEQLELGAKVFEQEKTIGPWEVAQLRIVIDELHSFLFHWPDDDERIQMIPEYPYLRSGVPKFSTDPRSEWVRLKKKALELFPVYTRVTVKRGVNRSWTTSTLKATRTMSRTAYYLEAVRILERARFCNGGKRFYRIKVTYDTITRKFKLVDTLYRWEIANFGMADYKGEFKVTNLSMDNNPPYKEGMMGTVEIGWNGVCIYDSAED